MSFITCHSLFIKPFFVDNLMSRYYFSFTYIFKTFLANLSWVEFKRVTKSGFNYIAFRIKKLGK